MSFTYAQGGNNRRDYRRNRRNQQGQRNITEYSFANGLVLGYSNREHQIPEGYAPYINNLNVQHDGSLSRRPSVHVWDTRHDAEFWNAPINTQFYMSYREDLTENFYINSLTSSTESGFPPSNGFFWNPVGTQTIQVGSIALDSYMLVGLGSSFGNTVICPFAIPNEGTITIPEQPPPPSDVPWTLPVPVQYLAIHDSGGGAGQRVANNLYDINGHVVRPEALSDLTNYETDGVFSRLCCLTVKGRIFVIAGTRISYSGPGQPDDFTVENGGGFIDLDTDRQVVGAFVLQDVIYIATRRELLSLSFSEDPGRDGTLRLLANIDALGAAEYDNIGYIAVRQGLYRVIQGQLEPTFIPSTDPDLSFSTYGSSQSDLETPVRVEIPRHCTVSRVGSHIVLGGIGVNSVADSQTESLQYTFVYNVDMDCWTTWRSGTSLIPGTSGATPDAYFNSFFNMTAPLVELPYRAGQATRRLWTSCMKGRTYTGNQRFRAFITEGRLEEDVDRAANIRIWPRLYDSSGHELNVMAEVFAFASSLATPWIDFGDPLSEKRLHRVWITGKFFNLPLAGVEDSNSIGVRLFNSPTDSLDVVNYDTINSDSRTVARFDISPGQIALAGVARFVYLALYYSYTPDTDWVTGWPNQQEFMDLALYNMYVDASSHKIQNKFF